MTDQERIIHIEGKLDKMLSQADAEGNGEVNILAIKNDMYWLIDKLEKAEKDLKEFGEIVKLHNKNSKMLHEKVDKYEKALKNIEEAIDF